MHPYITSFPLIAAFALLTACDAGDYTYSDADAAAAADVPTLNFTQEVRTATRACLANLENKADVGAALSSRGYAQSSKRDFVKTDPKVAFLDKKSRASVRVSFDTPRAGKWASCTISLRGVEENTAVRGATAAERAVLDASFATAKSAGFQAVRVPSRVGGLRDKLIKGATEISVNVRAEYQSASRSTKIAFSRKW